MLTLSKKIAVVKSGKEKKKYEKKTHTAYITKTYKDELKSS